MDVSEAESMAGILSNDEEYRDLKEQHGSLENGLDELKAKSFLSQDEQVQYVTLKKKKLLLKDRMEQIAHRYRAENSAAAGS